MLDFCYPIWNALVYVTRDGGKAAEVLSQEYNIIAMIILHKPFRVYVYSSLSQSGDAA